MAVIDRQGDNTNSTNTGGRTNCDSQRDEGIKTQPTHLYFVIKADFNVTIPGSLVPYVSESQVGIVGAKITVVKVSLDGQSAQCCGCVGVWGVGGLFPRLQGFGEDFRPFIPPYAFFVVVFFKWRLARANYFHSLGQDQSTVVQRVETTVTECSLTSCV